MNTFKQKTAALIIALTLSAITIVAFPTLFPPMPLIIWNASESVPIGWYLVSKRQPKIGEIGVTKPPDWAQIYASERGYLPQHVWLLKPVFAAHPSIICRLGTLIFVDGERVAKAKIRDEKKRRLPIWQGCKMLKPDEVFLLAGPRGSFDSRYFGPIQRDQIVGTALSIASTGEFAR